MTKAKKLKVLLSIDFDFFVRELPEFDWGHSETMFFLDAIWPIRYATSVFDVEREVDPDVHADFKPEDLGVKLAALFGAKKLFKDTPFAVAESHAALMKF